MKTIGLISDTHIPSRGKDLPKEVITIFLKFNVDLIIHCGDFESIKILESLKKLAPVVAVAGNMDSGEIKEKLPDKEIIKIEKNTIGITHGSGGKNGYYRRLIDKFKGDNVDIIFGGHTHYPEEVKIDGITIINPGSPTDKRFAPRNTVAIVKIDKKKIHSEFLEI